MKQRITDLFNRRKVDEATKKEQHEVFQKIIKYSFLKTYNEINEESSKFRHSKLDINKVFSLEEII
jgi:hypothetical protein